MPRDTQRRIPSEWVKWMKEQRKLPKTPSSNPPANYKPDPDTKKYLVSRGSPFKSTNLGRSDELGRMARATKGRGRRRRYTRR